MTKTLKMECSRCAVANTCPERGISPKILNNVQLSCRIIGGYGKVPIDASVLSDESKALMEKNGPCLTVAEVPIGDDLNLIEWKVIKIFSPPVSHERETTHVVFVSDLQPKSYRDKD